MTIGEVLKGQKSQGLKHLVIPNLLKATEDFLVVMEK